MDRHRVAQICRRLSNHTSLPSWALDMSLGTTTRFTRALLLVTCTFVTAVNLLAQTLPALPVPAGPPDVIFYNGKIVTVDSGFSMQEAFAVKGDQFSAVGSNAQVRKLAGPKTRQVDLKGHTVIPGLIDDHNHQYAAAINSRGVDVVGVSSLSEMLDRIRVAVAKAKPGEIVFTTAGYTFRPAPTRQQLDEISADVPIVVPAQGQPVLNAAALHAPEAPAGLPTGASPGPKAVGNPILPKIIPPPTQKEEEELILREQQKRNAEGLTSIRDLNVYPDAMRAYYRLWLQGKMTVRVSVGLRIAESSSVENVLSGWGMSSEFGDSWLRLDSISEDPHPALGKELRGTNFTPEMFEKYTKAIIAMNRYDWRFAPHIGDNPSLDLTLDAYEVADREKSIRDKRWIVEHVPDVTPKEMDRLARLRVLVSAQFQPYNSGSGRTPSGEVMADRAVPMRELLDHHLMVGAGSDTHGFGQIDNPFVPFYFYVTRKTRAGKIVGPQEKISREEALRVSTINNAYLTFEENVKGSIEPGKLADFVILNQDLLTVPEEQILSTHPLATYVGGKEVFASKDGGL